MSESKVKPEKFLREFKENAQWSLARYVALFKIENELESKNVPNSFIAAHLVDEEFDQKVMKITDNLLGLKAQLGRVR